MHHVHQTCSRRCACIRNSAGIGNTMKCVNRRTHHHPLHIATKIICTTAVHAPSSLYQVQIKYRLVELVDSSRIKRCLSIKHLFQSLPTSTSSGEELKQRHPLLTQIKNKYPLTICTKFQPKTNRYIYVQPTLSYFVLMFQSCIDPW